MGFVCNIIVVIILLESSLAIRQFDEEYPGVTICESSMTSGFQYFMPHSLMFLKGELGGNHNCTHVEGNLVIQNVWPDQESGDLGFLSSIIEVTGMIFMKNNSIKDIILPNLKVIRGQNSLALEKSEVSVYIDLLDEENSQYAIFPKLRVIANNSVYFKTKVKHKFLPQSIKWEELFENPKKQKLITYNKYMEHQCHSDCLRNDFPYCWSSSANHCQKQSKCVKEKVDNIEWCYFKMRNGEIDEGFCDEQCTGGCNGPKNSDCAVCKKYVNGNHCVEYCPPEFIYDRGNTKLNPNFKLRVGYMCANSCPVNLLQEVDACIYSCNSLHFYRVDNKCIRCQNSSVCAKKEFNINKIINEENEDVFYMTAAILKNFTDIEHVIGEFHFTAQSFDKALGGITLPMLYKHLGNVQYITGDLIIDGSNIVLKNLTFLQNLKEIRHLLTQSASAALNIMHTDLEFLGLRKLRRIFGKFEVHDSPGLCYADTLNWTGNILKNNQFDPIYPPCNKPCDSKCDSQGCWGPGSHMCYNCRGFRAVYNCVDRCEDEPGFYTNTSAIKKYTDNYDDGICQRCHPLCLQNCTGPRPTNCIGGCRYFKENDECVKNCSRKYFSFNKTCIKCHETCMENDKNQPLCTGESSILGLGGCSYCSKLIHKRDEKFYCYKDPCPRHYYLNKIDISEVMKRQKSKEIGICQPCLEPCLECSGNYTIYPTCEKCNGYWSGDRCVKQCFPIALNLPRNASCPYCNGNCVERCTVTPNDPFQCGSCNFKRLYLDNHNKSFQCVSECPQTHKYKHKDGNLTDIICMTRSQWLSYQENPKFISKWSLIILSVITVFLISSVYIFFRYVNKINQKKSVKYLKAIYSNIHEPDSRIILQNKKTIPNMNRLLLIPTTDLIFNINTKPIGTGAFGAVYRGVWKPSNKDLEKSDRDSLDVAVKVIRANRNIDIQEIMEEAKVMASVCHKHCLRLIGICLKYEMPCLITTFVELGSLDKYLRKHKSTLCSRTLLSWGEQIADGMTYLEIRGIIHRDLATRNVLLNDLEIIQITDFGLAHIVQCTEDNKNEIVISGGQVPIRWLALETLLNGIYSHKTDVWSFGITLWEIFTYGERPYDELDVREITSYLIQGNRLAQPEICSVDLYQLMCRCWYENANDRPSFETLMSTLSCFHQFPTCYLNIPNDSCLRPMKKDKHRLLSQISYDFQVYPKLNNIYKQHSLDGTISTFVGDYQDDIEGEPSLKRQSSGFSWSSKQTRSSQEIDKRLFYFRQHSAVSEDLEENDNFCRSDEQEESDSEYLEPKKIENFKL
uniref:receptor protein-tyrosine kinase n=1 Tax=Schmidtea mediterranea TaxID=79327 RepID=A0A1B1ACY2_SCHMD|nr:epidermal growth factor receptor Smed-egfr-2 [Schmidtea mediterranea]